MRNQNLNHSESEDILVEKLAVSRRYADGDVLAKLVSKMQSIGTAVSGGYNYKLVRKRLFLPNLPSAFNGLKVIHISDIHSGNLKDKDAVFKGVKMINDQEPDLIFFTGDMISHNPYEVYQLIDVFSHLKAKIEICAVLGNHDYGDYMNSGIIGKNVNSISVLESAYQELGWDLLNNENRILKRKGQRIAILGTENWSSIKRFPRYGDLEKAYEGAEDVDFKLLLTHDPTHWSHSVADKIKEIKVTFSGHTHGFQFGLGISNYKWSPAQYFHKHWKGLYRYGDQYLYVNPGFGFIGLPGRIGMPPEITLLQLANA